MSGMEYDKIIILSTPFPTIPVLGKHCCCDVIVFYVGNKRYCSVLEGARASTGLSLLCVDLSLLCVDLGYKQWSNDRPLCA